MFYLSAPHQNAFPFVALTLVASNLTRSPPNKFTNNQNRQFQASAKGSPRYEPEAMHPIDTLFRVTLYGAIDLFQGHSTISADHSALVDSSQTHTALENNNKQTRAGKSKAKVQRPQQPLFNSSSQQIGRMAREKHPKPRDRTEVQPRSSEFERSFSIGKKKEKHCSR